MLGTNARSGVTYTGFGLLLSGILLLTVPGTAGILDATWTAPTTNTDGSPLTDLASYRLYYDTSSSPCPGSASIQVASPASSPGPNQMISARLTGLTTGVVERAGGEPRESGADHLVGTRAGCRGDRKSVV